MSFKILQIGYGNMGSAIADAIITNKNYSVKIIDPNIENNKSVNFCNDIKKLNMAEINLIIFAIKPQNISQIIEIYQGLIHKNAIIISILAGSKIDLFKRYFPDNKIVRIMPNLAAKIKQSTNLAYAKDLNNKEQKEITTLLNCFGKTIWLDNEEQFHAGTAIAGSGPAYYFLLFKYFSSYLEQAGYREENAKKIVLETAYAATNLAIKEQDFTELTKKVASKGGTTEAALEIFEHDAELARLVNKALNAAVSKSKIL